MDHTLRQSTSRTLRCQPTRRCDNRAEIDAGQRALYDEVITLSLPGAPRHVG